MIGHYKMSLVGSSHIENNCVCQDASDVRNLSNGWVAAAIADGLGSAKHSEVGSSVAVKTVLDFIEENVIDSWNDESLYALLRLGYHAALKAVISLASDKEDDACEYDTTLTTIIYNGSNVVFAHVGDGGVIALNPYGDFMLLTTPQKGESFNETTPLRSGPSHWSFGKSNETICSLLMMTDGIFDMAYPWLLTNQEQRIYINYVRPFMDRNILSVTTDADFLNAEHEIEEFFSSDSVSSITDDKTIVGIINTEYLPDIKEEDYYREPDWEKIHSEVTKNLYTGVSYSNVCHENDCSSGKDNDITEVSDCEENKAQCDATVSNKEINDSNNE